MRKLSLALGVALAALSQGAWAKVQLPAHFTSNMVLQQRRALKIRGLARPGSEVTLAAGWSKKGFATAAGADGSFTLEVTTPKAGGPYTLTFSDGETTALDNVLVGEVWLGGGQSNMEMPLAGWGKILNYEDEIKRADYPQIRLLKVQKQSSATPREQIVPAMGGWQQCDPEHVANFSALCYFFALNLWNELGVPVGVIDDDWGGTPCESWISAGEVARVTGYDELTKQEVTNPHHPSVLYNAMIHPLTGFPVKGWIWYQGCTNVGRAAQHEMLFQTLIADWRDKWGQPDAPFYFVQLANFRAPSDCQPESEWAKLRESQERALCLPRTGMAVNIDLGTADDIHPKTKRELGRRLSAIALNRTYGRKTPCSAPVYKDYTVEGREVRVRLAVPDGGEPLAQGDKLKGFIMAGPDKKWHEATARAEGNDLVVTCPEVRVPMAVRYGWADNPTCPLRTKSGLRVAPFRTDKW